MKSFALPIVPALRAVFILAIFTVTARSQDPLPPTPAAAPPNPAPSALPSPAEAGPRPQSAAASGQWENPYPFQPSPDKEDCAICRRHLELIRDAIFAYRKDHKRMPNWLSDLVPDYLSESVLVCPVTRKTDRLSPYGPLDPKLRCSYLYELSPALMSHATNGSWGDADLTFKQWKMQQMGVLGSEVPMVRCLMHDPVQNLSFGGRIYDSGLIWEDNYLDVTTSDQLVPHPIIPVEPGAPAPTPTAALPSTTSASTR